MFSENFFTMAVYNWRTRTRKKAENFKEGCLRNGGVWQYFNEEQKAGDDITKSLDGKSRIDNGLFLPFSFLKI